MVIDDDETIFTFKEKAEVPIRQARFSERPKTTIFLIIGRSLECNRYLKVIQHLCLQIMVLFKSSTCVRLHKMWWIISSSISKRSMPLGTCFLGNMKSLQTNNGILLLARINCPSWVETKCLYHSNRLK